MNNSDSGRGLLRHSVATLAYRAGKALGGAPASFADFHASPDTRTPGQILAHMGDLFDWALSIVQGQQQWHDSVPLAWPDENRRFFAALEAFDGYLASENPLATSAEKLLQAPIADALTHVGQIALMRRLAGVPIRGENYYVAKIEVGSVSADQAAPLHEFS